MSTLAKFTSAFHEHFTTNPNGCVSLGVDRRLDELPDPSLAHAQRQVRAGRALVDQIDTIDASTLGFDDALDLELAREWLEQDIHDESYTFGGQTMREAKPSAGYDIGSGIFKMFTTDPRPAGDRLANITARLECVPDYVDASLARLGAPVERWVAVDVEETAGLPEFFASIVGWASLESWPDLPRLEQAVTRATHALAEYTTRLQSLPVTHELHVGPDVARRIVALSGIELSLEELHAIARDFLRDTNAIIEELRGRIVDKYDLAPSTTTADLQRELARRFAVEVPDGRLERVLEVYEKERGRILSFIQARDLFPVPDGQDMKILRTPAFLAPSIPAGAMDSPPPFREGVRTSIIYLTLSPELLDEHTRLEIPGMMVHEGIPGHHLQLATASMHPSVIRRHYGTSHHAEGWTTMLEDYMLDQGFMGELENEARFHAKRGISRLGARVAIDLFFMTGDRDYLEVGVDYDRDAPDPFVAAGSLLEAVTGFVPGRVEGEVNWYSTERGIPLSYLTGNHLVWKLKSDLIAHASETGAPTGIELDRRFHRVYLESGNMPVSALRRVFAHEGMLG